MKKEKELASDRAEAVNLFSTKLLVFQYDQT